MISLASKRRQDERGNALFLILIAVALFAALSYAVTQSGRGGGNTNKETGTINAAAITDFPAAVRTAITRMTLTGTSVGLLEISQNDPTTPVAANEVFNASGGGATLQQPPSSAVGTGSATLGAAAPGTVWRFKSAISTAAGGWFIKGIGTDTDAAGRDSFAFVSVNNSTCIAINRGLGLSATIPVEAGAAVVFTSTAAKEGTPSQDGGTAAATDDAGGNAFTIGQGQVATNGAAQAFACIDNETAAGSGPYAYYHALVEQ